MIPQFDPAYHNFSVTTSLVIFGFDGENLRILTTKRKDDPFKGGDMLPSRFIKTNESTEDAVDELMAEYTQVNYTFAEQLKAFSKVYRNPSGRVINIAFYAIVKLDVALFKYSDKRGDTWIEYSNVPELILDHNEIIEYAKERLKRRVKRRPIGFFLLPKYFTITQLQKLYEKALNLELDKRNFRKKIMNSHLIMETELIDNTARKSSKLYMFDEEKYGTSRQSGYDFLF